MGVYQSIYMGPYIMAPTQIRNITTVASVCLNKECKEYKKDCVFAYCPKCGAASQAVNKTIKQNYRTYSALSEKFEDSLMPRGDDSILTPNQHLKGAYNTHIDSQTGGIYDLPSDEIKARDIELMKEQYKKEIELLQSEKFEVTFHYGLIIDFS